MFFKKLKVFLCISLLILMYVVYPGSSKIDAAGQNLIANPGFEADLTNWSNWGGVSIVTNPVNSGLKAAEMGPGESGAGQIISGIQAGKVYTLSGSGMVSTSGEMSIIGVDCLDSNGNKLANGKFEISFNTTSYTQKSVYFTTVPGTAEIQVYIYKNPNVGGYAYADDISLLTGLNNTKGTWLWDPSNIATASAQNDVINFCQTKGINIIYLSTGMYQGQNYLVAHPDQYRAFISAAHQNGIRIESLDGESDWVYPQNQYIPLSRIQDVLNYDALVATNERFDGVHHDNEPYTLPD